MNKKYKSYLVERKRITNLAEQVSRQYQEMADERGQIHEWEWEGDFDFTILGLIELYSSYVGGYASQIARRGTVRNPVEAIDFLQEKSFFDEDYLVDWYFAPDNHYFKVKEYVEEVDYLRLLVIQYLRRPLNDTSKATNVDVIAKSSTDEMDSTFSIPSNQQVEALQPVTA